MDFFDFEQLGFSDHALRAFDACNYFITANANGYKVETTEDDLYFETLEELQEFFENQFIELELTDYDDEEEE